MKKFNLEDAKAGKPVCTRKGDPVRLICFDAKLENDQYTLYGLRTEGDYELLCVYTIEGLCSTSKYLDLVMAPEKKEGWANMYVDKMAGGFDVGVVCGSKEDCKKAADITRKVVGLAKLEWEV